MFARASTLTGDPANIDRAIEDYQETISTLRAVPGNRGAFLLVQRERGTGIGVTLWEDEQAATESRERANELREAAAGAVGATIESVEEYEVAVWEV